MHLTDVGNWHCPWCADLELRKYLVSLLLATVESLFRDFAQHQVGATIYLAEKGVQRYAKVRDNIVALGALRDKRSMNVAPARAGEVAGLRYTQTMTNTPAPAKPSASVVVVRDGTDGIEVLMLRRNEKIAFHGGAWVFPGGRVDAEDGDYVAGAELEVAKRAAVRETLEETGLAVTSQVMLPFAHWTTPVELPKRFATWFFAAPVIGADEVRIDNSEIIDYRWLTPAAALQLQAAGELELPAPTYVTLLGFSVLNNIDALIAHLGQTEVQHFVPRLLPIEHGRCTVYREDAAYESLIFDAPGPRHRLVMKPGDWRYIREF